MDYCKQSLLRDKSKRVSKAELREHAENPITSRDNHGACKLTQKKKKKTIQKQNHSSRVKWRKINKLSNHAGCVKRNFINAFTF